MTEKHIKNGVVITQKPKRVTVRQCEIACNLDQFDLEYMEKVLTKKKKDTITHWAYIIHNKDAYDKDGERADGSTYKKGDLKAEHIHLMMKFKTPQAMHNIADWFEVKPNQVEKIKGKWVSALRYLIHENHPEKYQYDIEEVKSNFDYSEEKDKIGYNKNARKLRKEEIISKIATGEWRQMDIYDREKITEIEFVDFKSDIDKAFTYRQKFLELNNTGRNMKVIYVSGESGSGKTTLAKEYAEKLGYSVYVSDGGKNPMDNYMGQDCVILDDFRPQKMEFSDLLKLLDNHTASMANARYSNKYMGECKLIIITNVCGLNDFFKGFDNHNKEPIKQLERRCYEKWVVTNDHIDFFEYDGADYHLEGRIKNPLINRKFEPREKMGVNAFAKAFGGDVEMVAGF